MAGGFLLDGNRRGQSFDQIHIRLVHALQKLARIGRQAFHITPLAFGIQSIKRQTGFARAGQTGDHHQLVARNIEVYVFQVVGAGTAQADLAERTASVDMVKQVIGVCGGIHVGLFVAGNLPS